MNATSTRESQPFWVRGRDHVGGWDRRWERVPEPKTAGKHPVPNCSQPLGGYRKGCELFARTRACKLLLKFRQEVGEVGVRNSRPHRTAHGGRATRCEGAKWDTRLVCKSLRSCARAIAHAPPSGQNHYGLCGYSRCGSGELGA